MSDFGGTIDDALSEVQRLRREIARGNSRQVSSATECDLIRATAYSWFKKHRPLLPKLADDAKLMEVDECYRALLDCSGRSTTRERYKRLLADTRKCLIALRSENIRSSSVSVSGSQISSPAPDFTPLVSDAAMRAILERRWRETTICMESGAYLAATVMMGALLEALLLARVNRTPNLSQIFKSKCAPCDKGGKPLQLKDWTLRHYIDVAHEQNWIRQSARDVGVIIRDYRNYIHPAKELAHGVSFEQADVEVLWPIFTSVAAQIVASA